MKSTPPKPRAAHQAWPLPARARRSRTLPPCDQCLTPSVAVYTKTVQVLSDIEMSRRAIARRLALVLDTEELTSDRSSRVSTKVRALIREISTTNRSGRTSDPRRVQKLGHLSNQPDSWRHVGGGGNLPKGLRSSRHAVNHSVSKFLGKSSDSTTVAGSLGTPFGCARRNSGGGGNRG